MLTNTDAVVNAVRYAVKAQGSWSTFVTDNGISRETVGETAKELAALAFPNDEQVQTVKDETGKQSRTRFGNAVQAARAGMLYVLDKSETSDTTTKNLLTREGKNAELAQVIAEWEAAQVTESDAA